MLESEWLEPINGSMYDISEPGQQNTYNHPIVGIISNQSCAAEGNLKNIHLAVPFYHFNYF